MKTDYEVTVPLLCASLGLSQKYDRSFGSVLVFCTSSGVKIRLVRIDPEYEYLKEIYADLSYTARSNKEGTEIEILEVMMIPIPGYKPEGWTMFDE